MTPFNGKTTNSTDDESINDPSSHVPILPLLAPSDINSQDVDAMLIRELNLLNFHDRERCMEEIHGCHARQAMQQDTQKLPNALQELQHTLDSIKDKPVYDQAIQQQQQYGGSRYVLDATFRTKFLRAEQYDVVKAANRMLQYLALVLEVYGSVGLMRPIQLSDLHPDAVAIVQEGSFAILPGRDTAGRRVIVSIGDVGPQYDVLYRAQAAIYIWQCLSDDVDTQLMGAVVVHFVHRLSQEYANDMADKKWISRLQDRLPVRKSAVHLCLPDNLLGHSLKATYMLVIARYERARMRLHIGSITECMYALKSFGIPTHYLPPNLNMRARDFQRQQKRLFQQRQALEALLTEQWSNPMDGQDQSNSNILNGQGQSESNTLHGHDQNTSNTLKGQDQNTSNTPNGQGQCIFSVNNIILCPRREDCLFGKGQPIMKHPGNMSMRKLLEERWERYEGAVYRQEKMDIAWEVVFEIQRGHGRFLREEPPYGWFVEVDRDAARQKISIAFRDIVQRKKKRIEEGRQSHDTSPSRSLVSSQISCSTPQWIDGFSFQTESATTANNHESGDGLDLSCGALQKRRKHWHGVDCSGKHCCSPLSFK
jgi:hypothetical protein